MIQFKVSVPGNLNLFGEYGVKYDSAGLMGSIDLRTALTFEETSNSDIIFHVDYPNICQTLNAPLKEIQNFYNYRVQDIELLSGELLQCLANVFESPNHTMIVHAFLYLLTYIAYKEQIEIKAFRMQLSTKFLMGNEFACSASITICLVTCFLNWSRLQKGVTDTFDDANIKKILSYATHYEEISSQSGIVDAFTCLFGPLTQYGNGRITSILRNMPSMTILLVDSKEQKQCSDAQMQQVAELMQTAPQMTHSVINTINDITRYVYNIFQNLVNISKDKNLDPVSRLSHTTAHIKMLEMFTRTNQQLLESFNVSLHADNICLTALKYGMCGKSAGNGSFVYIWCPEHVDESCTHKELLMNELTMQGFHVIETKFDHEGTKIEVVENLKINLNK